MAAEKSEFWTNISKTETAVSFSQKRSNLVRTAVGLIFEQKIKTGALLCNFDGDAINSPLLLYQISVASVLSIRWQCWVASISFSPDQVHWVTLDVFIISPLTLLLLLETQYAPRWHCVKQRHQWCDCLERCSSWNNGTQNARLLTWQAKRMFLFLSNLDWGDAQLLVSLNAAQPVRGFTRGVGGDDRHVRDWQDGETICSGPVNPPAARSRRIPTPRRWHLSAPHTWEVSQSGVRTGKEADPGLPERVPMWSWHLETASDTDDSACLDLRSTLPLNVGFMRENLPGQPSPSFICFWKTTRWKYSFTTSWEVSYVWRKKRWWNKHTRQKCLQSAQFSSATFEPFKTLELIPASCGQCRSKVTEPVTGPLKPRAKTRTERLFAVRR